MSQVGWKDPASGEEKTFDLWLEEAAQYGDVMGYPYEVLLGMSLQQQGAGRPDGITATQLLGCARAEHLEKLVDYHADPATNYPSFRGVIGHAMLEKFQNPDALVEERFYRRHRGIEVSGQLDKFVVTGTPYNKIFAQAWLSWCKEMYEWESAGEPGDQPTRPNIPTGTMFHIEDWKTKHEVPFGNYVYQHHQQQGNVYRWLLRVPQHMVSIRFIYVSMNNVKPMQLFNGGSYANGREKPKQIWDDSAIEAFLDDRLLILDMSRQLNKPLPYDKVPADDLWECKYCPVREVCYSLAAQERQTAWERGEKVGRVPPRDPDAESKATLPKKKRKAA